MSALSSAAEVSGPPSEGSGAAPVDAQVSAPAPRDVGGWFALQSHDPQSAREWALAMRKPIEYSLESLQRRPRRAAELLAPVMEAALVEHRHNRVVRWKERAWKWMAILTNPSLWTLSVQALWEGEPVWEYMERRAGWYQVVESVLVASGTHTLLGRAETKWRRRAEGEQPLQDLLRVPVATPDDSMPDSGNTPVVADADGTHVMVMVGVYCRLAVRVCGHPPASLRPALQTLCQESDRMLERANIDPGGRAAMIDRLLQRTLLKNSPASSPWTLQSAIVLGIIASLMLLALVTYIGKQERLWQDAVRALREEPGLQVVGESTSWGTREIRGLRDPLARDPEEVLNHLGFDTSGMALKFKGYLSAEEPFLLKHITSGPRQVIAVSPSPPMTDESPELPETAPLPIVTAPRNMPSTVAMEPESTREAKGDVESITIAFQRDSEALAGGYSDKLRSLARQVRQLQDLAAANAQELRVAMRIHQTSGTASGSLWQRRQALVRSALELAGVTPQSIDPTLITTAARPPIQGSTDTLSLRLSFESASARP